MGANLLVLLLTTSVLPQSPAPDSASPYLSQAVQHLVERAMARRRLSDAAVSDYQAAIRYRLSVGVGRRLWSKVPASAVEEQVARVQWQQPNDLRVNVIGRRFRSRNSAIQLSSVWDRPWFVPRGVDDSVRIFSNDFPATGALHPRRLNSLANRVVSIDADLEYGLQDGQYWMPYRQVIAGRVRLPLVSDVVIPFQATTTFDDYAISLRAGRGRYELHRPSNVTLERYDRWPDSLSLDADPADLRRLREAETELARLSDALPDSITGQQARGIAYERLSDALRYDRVQGLSLGLGYRLRVPGARFTSLYGTVRYGLSDDRVTGRLSLVRDAPGGRVTLRGYRDIVEVDPFSPGRTVGNTLNALFAAHDNADYVLAEGGSASFETSLRTGLDLVLGARVEWQTSVGRQAKSAVNDFLGGDGVFPANPPVDAGTLGGGSARLSHTGGVRWNLTADALGGGGRTTGRLYGDLRAGLGGERGVTLRLKGGIATSPTLQQSQFRLGGLATVRGFEYGERRGQAFWAAQLDVAPFGGRLRPVAFVDAGQAARLGDLFSSEALAGAGVGVSLFGGALRFDLSHPLTPDTGGKVRFDIVVQAVR